MTSVTKLYNDKIKEILTDEQQLPSLNLKLENIINKLKTLEPSDIIRRKDLEQR